MQSSRPDRRRFLKYIGAGAIAAGGAGAAYRLFMDSPRKPATIPTAAPITTQTTTRTNNPPVPSAIRVNPFYINPTTEHVVQLSHVSYDPDGDPLITTWLIDGKQVSHEHDYFTKLPEGEHVVDLQVSDGKQTRASSATVAVEPDQIYPTRELRIEYKGMRYAACTFGPHYPSIPTPSRDEMDEQLSTIHDELGCNAIIIMGGGHLPEKLVECAQLAIRKGFNRIYIQPNYVDATIDEVVDGVTELASEVRPLREISDAIVLMIGHELGLDTYGIIPGKDWLERARYQLEHRDWFEMVRAKLPSLFARLISTCKKNYGQKIAYAAAIWEIDLVPWDDPVFESVSSDAYLCDACGWNTDWIVRHLQELKTYRKPVNSSEWGCDTFSGAARIAAFSPVYREQNPYDENDQADYVRRYCDMLNRARISGCFYTQYNENYDKGYGLYNPVTRKRKKAFYMYKSYERVY
jgi:hypothetical protein